MAISGLDSASGAGTSSFIRLSLPIAADAPPAPLCSSGSRFGGDERALDRRNCWCASSAASGAEARTPERRRSADGRRRARIGGEASHARHRRDASGYGGRGAAGPAHARPRRQWPASRDPAFAGRGQTHRHPPARFRCLSRQARAPRPLDAAPPVSSMAGARMAARTRCNCGRARRAAGPDRHAAPGAAAEDNDINALLVIAMLSRDGHVWSA